METFKQRMKRIRLRAGFKSQGDAAERIGCERGTVSMWEAPSSNVQSVSSDLLFATARAYQVRPDWINNLKSTSDGYPWSGGQEAEQTALPASQFGGQEEATMRSAILWLQDQFHGWRRQFNAAERTGMILEVFHALRQAAEPNWIALSQRFADQLEREGDEREGKVRGAGEDDRSGDTGRARKAKVAAGRA